MPKGDSQQIQGNREEPGKPGEGSHSARGRGKKDDPGAPNGRIQPNEQIREQQVS